jgi:hypothetical protein
MASARCVYCDATLTPNSAYCLECGQQIPQASSAPSPATPVFAGSASRPDAAPQGGSSAAAVPLPRSLPWQTTRAPESEPTPVVSEPPRVIESVELVLGTGQRVRVSGPVVLGRQPADTARTMGARSVAVPDDTRSVSRVHLFLEVAGGKVTVADAGSANGSRLQRGGTMYQLESGGAAVQAAPGDVVWLGDVSVSLLP